jgi:hypothetical protein
MMPNASTACGVALAVLCDHDPDREGVMCGPGDVESAAIKFAEIVLVSAPVEGSVVTVLAVPTWR